RFGSRFICDGIPSRSRETPVGESAPECRVSSEAVQSASAGHGDPASARRAPSREFEAVGLVGALGRLVGMATKPRGLTRRGWMSAAALPIFGAIRRPNVVFILVDDLRWDELRCTGHPYAISPNADRLAREGANFQNAFATTPLCSP